MQSFTDFLLVTIPVSVVIGIGITEVRSKRRESACFAYDLSLAVQRYRDATGCDEAEAKSTEREFRRFFLLMADSPGQQFGLHNGAIDDFWHELICCTALYADFCQTVAGRFIHHDPQGGSGSGYGKTWWAYHDRFGEAPPLSYWPTPEPSSRNRRQHDNGYDAGCGGGGGCSGGSSCGDGGGGGGGCCGSSGCGGGGGCGGGCGGGH